MFFSVETALFDIEAIREFIIKAEHKGVEPHTQKRDVRCLAK
jgi:hypothetical protein